VWGLGVELCGVDTGAPIGGAEMARNLSVLSGRIRAQDITIDYSGPRTGDKMYEELFDCDERVEPTAHDKIKRAVSEAANGPGEFDRHLRDLEKLTQGGDQEATMRKLKEMVTTYQAGTSNATP